MCRACKWESTFARKSTLAAPAPFAGSRGTGVINSLDCLGLDCLVQGSAPLPPIRVSVITLATRMSGLRCLPGCELLQCFLKHWTVSFCWLNQIRAWQPSNVRGKEVGGGAVFLAHIAHGSGFQVSHFISAGGGGLVLASQ